jgi:hypothetical protein
VLLAIYLQEPLTFQDNAAHVYLGVDVQRYTFPFVEAQKVAIEVRAFQGENGPLDGRIYLHIKEVDNFGFHLVPPDSAFADRASVAQSKRTVNRRQQNTGNLLFRS